jgi:uncharacterized membrane protein YfcA
VDELTLAHYALVAGVALVASVIGGVAGYGPGLLMPPILAPLIGADAVIPVMSVAGVMTNSSRIVAFWQDFDARLAKLIVVFALAPCLIGAYAFTRLTGAGAALLLGTILILIVPLRYWLIRRHGHLTTRGVALGGAGYGVLIGGTAGTGIVLLSILLATGLHGRAVVATDAGISFVLGLTKVSVFQAAGALPLSSWLLALLIGVSTMPGAFIAKRLTRGLSLRAHAYILDAAVVVGGTLLLWQGLRG